MTMAIPPIARNSQAKPVGPTSERGLKVLLIRIVNYLTNGIVASFPSYALRHAWYRHVLGVELQPHAAIQRNCYIWFFSPGGVRRNRLLRIGEHTMINRGCCLDTRGGITIGNNVSIAAEVAILTAQHEARDPDFRVVTRPVVIEDHVSIGMRATILPGVTIGRGAVIAAGAVVTNDVAPLDVVGGVPARPIGRRGIDPDYTLGPAPLFE